MQKRDGANIDKCWTERKWEKTNQMEYICVEESAERFNFSPNEMSKYPWIFNDNNIFVFSYLISYELLAIKRTDPHISA